MNCGRFWLRFLNRFCCWRGDFWPDLTIVLDGHELDRATAREEQNTDKEDRYERMGGDFHEKLQQSFLDIAKNNQKRCTVISAAGTIDDVAKRVWESVDV